MGIKLIWQTGRYFYETARIEVEKKKLKNIQVHEFINRMDLAYSAADVVVSRAGAIAISELCLAGKPVIFVPLPTAAEDHQTKNAQALVSKKSSTYGKKIKIQKSI